uniref:HAT C-terminal dimerisation domain-containing protein n=1 Tax=Lactuca sativa TaxID=4236 RepID=A0A9R1WCL7_LACSA|nr:hypothetical protein LSAT_V11C200061220 [Lactuca sativa]
MVETKRDKVYSMVYLLIKLALTLPVSTATVERSFFTMKIVKNRKRNKMGDQWINDNLVTYIEKEVFTDVANQDISNILSGDSKMINSLVSVDLVIDHSVEVDVSRSAIVVQSNMYLEFQHNDERFSFLKWG